MLTGVNQKLESIALQEIF